MTTATVSTDQLAGELIERAVIDRWVFAGLGRSHQPLAAAWTIGFRAGRASRELRDMDQLAGAHLVDVLAAHCAHVDLGNRNRKATSAIR